MSNKQNKTWDPGRWRITVEDICNKHMDNINRGSEEDFN
jgi:hypothetical protein